MTPRPAEPRSPPPRARWRPAPPPRTSRPAGPTAARRLRTAGRSRPPPAAADAAARKVLGWPKLCKLVHALLWECSYKRLKLAQLLGKLGVFLASYRLVPTAAAHMESMRARARARARPRSRAAPACGARAPRRNRDRCTGRSARCPPATRTCIHRVGPEFTS